MKRCTKCDTWKKHEEFGKDRQKPDGLSCHCKLCIRLKGEKYYARNRKAILEDKVEYHAENRELVIGKMRNRYAANNEQYAREKAEYRAANPEKTREISRRAYVNNIEIIKERQREYGQRNPHVLAHRNAKSRAAKMERTPPWFEADAVKAVYRLAAAHRRNGRDVHVDHIIPLQGKLVSGLHCRANLQILDASENMSKQNNFRIS